MRVDSLQFPVPDLDEGAAFYSRILGASVRWRTPTALALTMNDGTEVVLQTERREPETDILVQDADQAAEVFVEAGGSVKAGPFDIPVGRCVVVADPWGTQLVLLDLSKGTYETDASGRVTGVSPSREAVHGPELLPVDRLGIDHPAMTWFTGRTSVFAYGSDQRFSYNLYLPDTFHPFTPDLSVLVVVHGTRRNAEAMRNLFIPFADEHHCAVVAPLFPAGIGDPNDIDNYKAIEYRGIRFDLVLLGMLDEIAARWGLDVGRFALWGFSGGGIFAHRFLYLHPERLLGVSIGSPGRVTPVDAAGTWPEGMSDFGNHFGHPPGLDAISKVPVHLWINEDDEGPGRQRGLGQTGRRAELLVTLRASLERIGSTVRLDVPPSGGHTAGPAVEATHRFLVGILPARPTQ